MKYQDVTCIDREEAKEAIASGERERICDALIRLAFHDEDWRWVQDLCLNSTRDSDNWVKRTAVVCLGHLARIHRRLDLDKVSPVLKTLLVDPDTSGTVEDALDDIKMFMRVDLRREWLQSERITEVEQPGPVE